MACLYHLIPLGCERSYYLLVDLFECLENYLSRLTVFSETPAMEGVLVKIMVELLAALALATEQIKQGRLCESIISRLHSDPLLRHREICKEVVGRK